MLYIMLMLYILYKSDHKSIGHSGPINFKTLMLRIQGKNIRYSRNGVQSIIRLLQSYEVPWINVTDGICRTTGVVSKMPFFKNIYVDAYFEFLYLLECSNE